MTAALTTSGEDSEHEQQAEFWLSERQSDMLKTLNTLFDQLSPAPITEEDFFDILDT